MAMNKVMDRKEAIEVLRKYSPIDAELREALETAVPELKENEDERIIKAIKKALRMSSNCANELSVAGFLLEDVDAWLDKQGRQKPAKNIVETWEDMRLEVGAQASGNRHEPQYSDNSTKLFSLNDIDEIIEKISEKQDSQNLANSAKTCKVEKKPHNICDTCENRYGCISPCPVKLVGQTSDWSEEDEQYLLVCKNALAKYQTTDKWDAGIISHWLEDRLKSLKERYTWKPSDEQMELLREVQQALLGKDCHNRFVNFMCDLKKLKG